MREDTGYSIITDDLPRKFQVVFLFHLDLSFSDMIGFVLFLLAAVLPNVRAECQTHFAAHEIISAPNKVLTFDDEAGFREIKAKEYNVGNCVSHPKFRTGTQYIGNYTLMGQESDLKDGSCLIKRIGGDSVYDSMQAVVIRTNGWTMLPHSIDLDDMDAQAGVPSTDGWKESMAIFGVQDGNLISPNIKFYEDTLLASKQYKVPASAMKEMELTLGDSYVPGGEYSAAEMFNCPFGRDNKHSAKCRMTASFQEPIDTLVLLYAITQKSKNDPNAAVFFSEIILQCGCRCRQTNAGTRKITAAIPGTPNECVQTETTAFKTECDVLGDKWCSKDYMASFRTTGPQLGSGNFPCQEVQGERVTVTGNFGPDSDFVPTSKM